MIVLNSIKHLFYFSIFFCILYFETISIGGIKFAIIWKGPVILFLAFRTLGRLRKIRNTNYLKYGYFYNFKMLFSLSGLSGIVTTINSIIRFVVFPLFIQYFHLFSTPAKTIYYIRTLSIYILISTIPFLLHILEPLKDGYDLSRYGIDGNGFIGVFQKPHSASMILSVAIMITIFFLKTERKLFAKVLLLILTFLGVIALVQTYVRTGFAMLLIGLAILYFQKKGLLYYFKIAPVIVVIGICAFLFYQSNEAMQMRFEERNVYQEESTGIDVNNLGSGRFMIAYYALENWWNEGPLSILFGLGEELARQRMLENKGSAIFAHNGFVETIQTEGLIGFSLFILFYFGIYKAIRTQKENYYYKINLVLFMMIMAGTFFQGGDNFMIYCLFALALTLLREDRKTADDFSPYENLYSKTISL